MTLSELCIRRPVMTTLMTASIIAFGVFGFRLLPVSALPKVDFPTIAVTATLPGASADTMAASVAGPIERQLSTIAGISSMSSSSSQGHDRDHHPVRSQPQHRCRGARRADRADHRAAPAADRDDDSAELPQGESVGLCGPVHLAVSETLPLSAVNEYGDITIGQALSQIQGVAQVVIFGSQKFAIRVQADPEAAAARGISLEDVRAAVSRANSSTPVGTLNGPKQDVALQASGQMDKAADYRHVIVAWRNGSPVRLDEIAKVYDSVENDKIATWFNGDARHRAGDLQAARRQYGRRRRRGTGQTPGIAGTNPPSVKIDVAMDRSVSIRQSVSDVEETLLIAVGLVILVIFLFLRSASGDLHSGAGGADLALRHLRGHVHAGFLHQQHDAAGADIVGRLRGRRRHRHAGKHRPSYRTRHAALWGSAARHPEVSFLPSFRLPSR